MEASLTECEASHVFNQSKLSESPLEEFQQSFLSKSTYILDQIYAMINSPSNHRVNKTNKSLISAEETLQVSSIKCKCKKSKCLKLYCECFASGSFCQGCNCECCHNLEEYSEIRAKAIDEVMIRAPVPFGHRNSSVKGCNCKKTGCSKKYCECFGSGDKCNEYCKCANCTNS